jgi:L-ascorbate metabolism protein UlaG (beta-lactamase superfamily)
VLPLLLLPLVLSACSEGSPESEGGSPEGAPATIDPQGAAPSRGASSPGAFPMTVRWWGHSMMSFETYWNHTIAMDPPAPRFGYPDPGIEADVVLLTRLGIDHMHMAMIGGTAKPMPAFTRSGNPDRRDFMMFRPPNESVAQVVNTEDFTLTDTPHAVHAFSFDSWAYRNDDGTLAPNSFYVIETDGVRIVHTGDVGHPELRADQMQLLGGPIDVLCISVGGLWSLDGPGAVQLIRQLEPRFVIPLHFRTDTTAEEVQLLGLDQFVDALPEDWEQRRIAGNTLTVSAAPPVETPVVLLMDYQPWVMPTELAELFAEKDAANARARAVFEPLSVAQMNHRPSDASHTPRWNAEHLMGAELEIFSRLYNSVDPSFPVIDLRPLQMPEDYVAAHPDWDGAEEARQLERVALLVRRHAHLLRDIDLDEPFGDDSMTLRGALELMAHHYGEHAANVRKKFALPDWPRE